MERWIMLYIRLIICLLLAVGHLLSGREYIYKWVTKLLNLVQITAGVRCVMRTTWGKCENSHVLLANTVWCVCVSLVLMKTVRTLSFYFHTDKSIVTRLRMEGFLKLMLALAFQIPFELSPFNPNFLCIIS